jgi:rhamnosyltransferase
MLEQETNIFAVIVTYNPTHSALVGLINSILNQVHNIVIVDNASVDSIKYLAGNLVSYFIQNDINKGLAEGQNQGISVALSNDASHVILFDQDSEPCENMVENLVYSERRLIELGFQVAAVGPRFIDIKSNETSPFLSLNKLGFNKKFAPDFEEYAEAFCLISSGQMIRSRIIREVGMMREDLFIDFIDVEWGLRASDKGYKCFGVFNAKMNHNYGDKSVKVRNKALSLHNPIRHYYIARNAIILYRSGSIPLVWKIADGMIYFKRLALYVLFSDNKAVHLKYIAAGIRDGLFGKTGEYK